MTKNEFLHTLGIGLAALPKSEREERIEELEADIAVLEEEITELQCKVADAEAKALAAANERDDAKEALLELRRALVLVAQLAGVK